MNKYHQLLKKILEKGIPQQNKKGDIIYLINQELILYIEDIVLIFTEHKVARKKLTQELDLYMSGVEETRIYNNHGITWWDYCKPKLKNTYPKYFKKLPELIHKINTEKRSSKNYILFIGETGVKTCQLPCLSLIQFQLSSRGLDITVYQRSADSNLGLPADIYQIHLISKMIDIQLNTITFYIGNAHIYKNNIEATNNLLNGKDYQFILNT